MSAIAVIGGSGLYDLEGLSNIERLDIETPFDKPSDTIIGGDLNGQKVWFLPRHGKGHRLLPSEIPHRANFWALSSLGVQWVIGVGAVGSLKEELPPLHVVLPDQFYDRTTHRSEHTLFGQGIVAHLPFGHPTNNYLRSCLADACSELGLPCQSHGTYVNMDGPAFSTKAESEVNRSHGFDLIGMTHVAEAKLARESEMAYASLCLVTDYDCWKDQDVNVQEIIKYLKTNVANAKRIIDLVTKTLKTEQSQPEFTMLDTSILTPVQDWPANTQANLEPILKRFLANQ